MTIQAFAFMKETDPLTLTLSDQETTEVRLEMKDSAVVKGRVVAAGVPFRGARVIVEPADVPAVSVIPATSDVRGEFGVTVPSRTRSVNILVQAPGHAFKMFRTAFPERPIEIPVEPLGGTLVVETPRFNMQDDNRQPFVLHGGADYEIALAIVAWGATFEDAGERYRIRVLMMERGQYTLCMLAKSELPRLRTGTLPPERCAPSGFLAPLGELTLSVK